MDITNSFILQILCLTRNAKFVYFYLVFPCIYDDPPAFVQKKELLLVSMQTILRIFSYLGKYPKLASCPARLCAILMTLMLLVFPHDDRTHQARGHR